MGFNGELYFDIGRVSMAREFVLDENNRCEYPHGRGKYGLCYGLDGEAEYRFFGGEKLKVKAGDLIFLPPYAEYSISVRKEYRHYTVNFDIRSGNAEEVFQGKNYLLMKISEKRKFESVFEELSELWRVKSAGCEMMATSCVCKIFGMLVSDNHIGAQSSAAYDRLLPAKKYIDANFAKEIDTPRA